MFKNLTILATLMMVCFLSAVFAQNENPIVEKLYKSAEKNLDTGSWDAAIADYIKIIAIVPDDADAYNGRGFAYLGKHEYDKSIADFTKTLELKPDDFYTYYSRGKAYYLKGEYERAIEDHTKELELQPVRAIGRLERGNALMKMGRLDEALQDFHQTIVSSDMAAGFYSRAMAFQAKGDKQAAIADLRYYLKRIPDDDTAREQMIKLGVNLNDLPAPFIKTKLSETAKKAFAAVFDDVRQAYYNEAVFKLGALIRTDPRLASAYFYRGYILEIQASELNWKQFTADYTKAVTIDPKFVEAYIHRAYRSYFINAALKGQADLTKARTLDPRSANAAYYSGIFYNRDDKWPKALTFFNLATKLDPDFVEAYLTRAEGYEFKKEYDKALADYSAVIKINPNDYRGYQGRAKIYCEQKKNDLAAADEKKTVELGSEPDSPCGDDK